jgi:hypothetical protein
VVDLALTALLAPLLVAAATLAGRRWGPHIGGVVSAFHAIVGPVLVIDLLMHDAAFAARAAAGTLLGLVALSAFAATYGRLAPRRGWRSSVLGAWAAAAVAAALLSGVDAGPLAAASAAAASIAAAAWVLRGPAPELLAPVAASRRDLGLRMGASAVLVVALAAAATALGPVAGGVLAALPVLASVLAVFTHRRDGAPSAVALLRGMLGGMGGFAAFCLAVALLVERIAPAAAFAVATAAALAAQVAAASGPLPKVGAWTRRPRSAASSRRSASRARPG